MSDVVNSIEARQFFKNMPHEKFSILFYQWKDSQSPEVLKAFKLAVKNLRPLAEECGVVLGRVVTKRPFGFKFSTGTSPKCVYQYAVMGRMAEYYRID